MFIRNLAGINRKSKIKISIVGGSNSVIRKGYAKYLDSSIAKWTAQSTALKYYSLGGVPNIYGTIQEDRYDIASNSDIIFFEYCVNDRHAIEIDHYSLELAGKSLEGFIRKAKKSNPNCLIIILIFGINLEEFYNNYCYLSELYRSIGKQYDLPVIDITELLSKTRGLDYVKSLYHDKDHAHYTRPHGVQIVSQTIVDQLDKMGIFDTLKSLKKFPKKQSTTIDSPAIYPDNFENLAYFDRFKSGNFFSNKPKISVYQNTVYRERNYTIYPGNSLNFLLKGKLMAIFIKSDLNDGFITIEFNNQRIVTSSYSAYVHKIRPQNIITLITLPLHRFSESQDFSPVSISLCQEYPNDFELDFEKTIPSKKDPQKWKLSIIGIAFIGKLKPLS